MSGFDVTRKIMQTRPTPIVVVSASVEKEDLNISMNALRAGALSVVEKPVNFKQRAYEAMAHKICTQLAIMSEVKVVSQRRQIEVGLTRENAMLSQKPPHQSRLVNTTGRYQWLGLVASTGGPKALSDILGCLPRDFPIPIFIVQHITESFHDGFVRWLDSITPLHVVKVENCIPAKPGKIYLPPSDHHLVLQNGHVLPGRGPHVCRQRPSGTVLFESMAEQQGQHAMGVLLTGMGEDGAKGLKAVKDAGGHTIVEDESTSVVYGMPAAAIAIDAACESLPLDRIAPRILTLLGEAKNGRMRHGNR
jgi:two-component system chemotaxis response regulator CheB